VDSHLAAVAENVGGRLFLEPLDEHPVGARRLGELLDFFLECHELVARLAQRGGEPLVAAAGRLELRGRLRQPLLEGMDPTRRRFELSAGQPKLVLEQFQLTLKLLHLSVVLDDSALVVLSDRNHLPWLSKSLLRTFWNGDDLSRSASACPVVN